MDNLLGSILRVKHLQQGYSDLGYAAGSLPISEQVARDVLSLPMFAELSEEQIEAIAMAMQSAISL